MSQHKLKKWIGRFIYSLIVGLIGGAIGYFLYPTVSEGILGSIEVSPKSIPLCPPCGKPEDIKPEIQSVFTVLNKNNEKMFYGVWIKIIPQNHKELKFKFIPLRFNRNKTFESSGKFICFDIFKVEGFDSKNRFCIWLNLYSLGPNQSRSFLLKIVKTSPKAKICPGAKVSLEVLRKSLKEPPPYSIDGDMRTKGRAETYVKKPEKIKDPKASSLNVAKEDLP